MKTIKIKMSDALYKFIQTKAKKVAVEDYILAVAILHKAKKQNKNNRGINGEK